MQQEKASTKETKAPKENVSSKEKEAPKEKVVATLQVNIYLKEPKTEHTNVEFKTEGEEEEGANLESPFRVRKR